VEVHEKCLSPTSGILVLLSVQLAFLLEFIKFHIQRR